MDKKYKYLLGEGHFPSLENLNIYINHNMGIFIPKIPLNISPGSHVHGSYEFSIPISQNPTMQFDKKKTDFEIGKIYPFNTEQEHSNVRPLTAAKFIGFQISKQFVQEVSHQVFGKEEIYFENKGFPIDQELTALFNMFIDETINKQTGHQFIIDGISTHLTINLFRKLKHNIPEERPDRKYNGNVSINKVIDFMMENYNKAFSLVEVSKLANFSPYHFIRIFKDQTGKTPYNYLLDIKVKKACELLIQRDNTITEVCYLCGFSNSSHFTTVFKRKIGISPSEYRKNL